MWARAQLTVIAALGLLVTAASIPPEPGRVRRVRTWITFAVALWLVAELVRNAELAIGSAATPGVADLFLVGVLSCAAVAYVLALRGQVERSEEIALYLDAAIVFFAVAALLLTAFGGYAAADPRLAADLAYVIFFISTSVATLLLDVTVRAERAGPTRSLWASRSWDSPTCSASPAAHPRACPKAERTHTLPAWDCWPSRTAP